MNSAPLHTSFRFDKITLTLYTIRRHQ